MHIMGIARGDLTRALGRGYTSGSLTHGIRSVFHTLCALVSTFERSIEYVRQKRNERQQQSKLDEEHGEARAPTHLPHPSPIEERPEVVAAAGTVLFRIVLAILTLPLVLSECLELHSTHSRLL